MKFLLSILLLALVPLITDAQPWMQYYHAPKQATDQARFKALKKAFQTYMEKEHAAGGIEEDETSELFERWVWLVEPRFSEEGQIPSDILWQEILKKQEARSKGELLGDWHLVGPVDPPTRLGTGQVIGSGRIDCIAFHPTDSNTFYIGAPTGGIWKTTDGGRHWTPLGDMLASIGISDIALYPGHPDTIFIATGDRDAGDLYSVGILRSNDGGATWEETGLSLSREEKHRVNRLIIRPDQPDTMIAAMSNGLYLITNEGMDVRRIVNGKFKDIELMPGKSSVIYAATYGNGATVYRSTDGGKTFREISNGLDKSKMGRIKLAVTPDKPAAVYLVGTDKKTSGLYGVYRSFDNGTHWTMLLSGETTNILGNSATGDSDDGQGWYDLAMAIDPENASHMLVGGINIWESTNGGGSWHLKTWGYPEYSEHGVAYIHVDQHTLRFQPGTGALFAGNDGGLYKSNDKGGSFTNLSFNLPILQIYRISTTDQKRATAMMGSQDNSTILWRDTSWNVVIGGDGMECIIDPTDTNTLYASSQYGNLKRSTDGGVTFNGIKPDNAGKGAWVTPYVMSPDDPAVLYAGYDEIYRTLSRGDDWVKLTNGLSANSKYKVIRISPRDPDFIYAGINGNLWRSEDGGISWRSIYTGLPSALSVTDLAISANDPREIWVTLSGFTPLSKVYHSTDGGKTWNNYSAGLPNVPVNCIIYQNNTNGRVYAGTDLGVYVRDRSMTTWKDLSNGLPNVIVNEMQIYYPDSMLRAGTYGRGLWESKLFFHDTIPLYAEYSSDKIRSCKGGIFTFYNEYPGKKDSLRWYFLPDGEPLTLTNEDTTEVKFGSQGLKDVALVIYHNGIQDSLYREAYIEVDTFIDLSIQKNFAQYYWKGNDLILKGKGADQYAWIIPSRGDTLYEEKITEHPDTTTIYMLLGTQGECSDTDTVTVNVWPNDNIRYALSLAYGENGPFVNYEATVENGEPMPPAGDCNTDSTWCDKFGTGQGYLAHSVWFRITAPATGVLSVDTKGFDSQIALYDSPSPDSILAGNYTLLAANDDYHGSDLDYAAALEEVRGLTPGGTYWLQFDGSGGNLEGTFYVYLYDSPLAVPKIFPDRKGRNSFTVYPNPNEGAFSVVLPEDIRAGTLLKIFAADGKLVHQQVLPAATTGEDIPFSFHFEEKGLYILLINAGRKTFSCRMIVR